MTYLYFDKENNALYLFTDPVNMAQDNSEGYCDCKWEDIESVTTDYEKGQINAHDFLKGKVAEFPINSTVLTCQKPKK